MSFTPTAPSKTPPKTTSVTVSTTAISTSGIPPDTLRPQRRARKAASEATTVLAVAKSLALLPLPRWVTSPDTPALTLLSPTLSEPASAHTPSLGQQDLQSALLPATRTAFAAGAAIFALDQLLRAEPAWLGCFRMRQALNAAGIASKLLRLNADEAALRDTEHLTRASDDPGPAGRLYQFLRQLTLRPTRLAHETLSSITAEIDGAPAATEVLALLGADIALAERLGWEHPLLLHLIVILDPALRQSVTGMRPCADNEGWCTDQHAVLARAAIAAHAQAVVLARKAHLLSTAANGLRTRDGGRGLALILADDSVAPWRMVKKATATGRQRQDKAQNQRQASAGIAGLGSDRAARRLCETLHTMGVLRLLTDRATFRLYGL
jgi:Protein of unknown function (DUF1403)